MGVKHQAPQIYAAAKGIMTRKITEPAILSREKFPEALALAFSVGFRVLEHGTDYPLTSSAVWWQILAWPGISASGIAFNTKIPPGTVAKDIRRMVKEGYVEQHFDEKDRRVRRLYATDESWKAANQCIDDLQDHVRRLRAEQGF